MHEVIVLTGRAHELTVVNGLPMHLMCLQKRALKVFTECDLDRRGSLQQRELAR